MTNHVDAREKSECSVRERADTVIRPMGLGENLAALELNQ